MSGSLGDGAVEQESSRRRCRLRVDHFAGCCEAFERPEDRHRYDGEHRRGLDEDGPEEANDLHGSERSEPSGPSWRRTATRWQDKSFREEVEALRAIIDHVEETAASDRETSARTEGDPVPNLSTAEGTIAALTETVGEQQLATQRESERSDLSLRLVESNREASLQEAAKARASTLAVREGLESCEQDLAEIDSASVDISLFAAERPNEGNLRASATCGCSEAGRERLLGFPRGGSGDVEGGAGGRADRFRVGASGGGGVGARAAKIREARMTAGQIKAELDALGVSYVSLLEKSEFVMKLAEAEDEKKEKEEEAASPAGEDAADEASAMLVSAIKEELDERGVRYRGLFEKSEFVDLLVDARAKGITAPPPSSSGDTDGGAGSGGGASARHKTRPTPPTRTSR
ncbi:hypothetical protein Esi_0630_0002 [Ectocarpus siliculosus]|uniref:Uncharacterized protein n=1 Tax=Ectocarpus siliculosus TaxID=2880 RepID=D7G5D2_ECTSI|nr:hypothetical protein Esi_0630_0002 [Ectocarpus siliculosus]|eukprot:CBJ33826.1 hypothetical protein Esi_0630_0002 [Ectocarpus siliculosus]